MLSLAPQHPAGVLLCPRSPFAGHPLQPYRLQLGWRRLGGGRRRRRCGGTAEALWLVCGPDHNAWAAHKYSCHICCSSCRPQPGRSAAGRRRAAAARRTWAGQPCADILDTRSSWPGGMAIEHCAVPSVGVSVALKKVSAIFCPAAGLQPQPPGRARDSRARCQPPWDCDRLTIRRHCGGLQLVGLHCMLCLNGLSLCDGWGPATRILAPHIARSHQMCRNNGAPRPVRPPRPLPPPPPPPLILVPMTDRAS